MKRPSKIRTPNHTWIILGRKNIIAHSLMDISKLCNRISNRLPDSTWIDLDQEPIFQKFMKEYIDLLQTNLQKVEVMGRSHNSSYYTCGQGHDRRNPAWQPFKLLSQICKKFNYGPLIARDIIEEKVYRRLECACQILGNQSQNRRMELL